MRGWRKRGLACTMFGMGWLVRLIFIAKRFQYEWEPCSKMVSAINNILTSHEVDNNSF